MINSTFVLYQNRSIADRTSRACHTTGHLSTQLIISWSERDALRVPSVPSASMQLIPHNNTSPHFDTSMPCHTWAQVSTARFPLLWVRPYTVWAPSSTNPRPPAAPLHLSSPHLCRWQHPTGLLKVAIAFRISREYTKDSLACLLQSKAEDGYSPPFTPLAGVRRHTLR